MSVRVDIKTLSVLAKKLVFSSFCRSDFYLGSISGVFRASRCGDFFRSVSDEIGNSDHQAVQAGCGA